MTVDPRLVIAAPALVACVLRNRAALDDAFADLAGDQVQPVVSYILARYSDPRDADQWEWVFTNCARANQRALARGLQAAPPPEHARAANANQPRPFDADRAQMQKMMFRLIRGGATSQRLISHSRAANQQLAKPIPSDELDEMMVWCAKKTQELKNAR